MATQAPLGPSGASLDRGLSKVASGQRLIIYAILLNLLCLVVKGTAGDVAGLAAGIVATVVALVGLFRLASGMGVRSRLESAPCCTHGDSLDRSHHVSNSQLASDQGALGRRLQGWPTGRLASAGQWLTVGWSGRA
jgi:hypothetical protein